MIERLVCVECGGHAPLTPWAWRAYLVGVHDELNDEEMVAVYCPVCAEREFELDT